MCLYVNINPGYCVKPGYGRGFSPLVSDRPITCYKILTKHGDTLVTPYMGEVVDLEKGMEIDEIDDIRTSKIFPETFGLVHRGIHSYGTLEKAESKANIMLNSGTWDRFEIYRCEIPQGTKYYEGIEEEYCSERINFIEKVGIYDVYSINNHVIKNYID